ncbi:hypothetical protein WCLP8_3250002 [uncultured Gammaproteobacteria bacterium]
MADDQDRGECRFAASPSCQPLAHLSLAHKAQFWLLERLRYSLLTGTVQPALDRREALITRLLAERSRHRCDP